MNSNDSQMIHLASRHIHSYSYEKTGKRCILISLLPGQRGDPEKNKDHIQQILGMFICPMTYNKYLKHNALNSHNHVLV